MGAQLTPEELKEFIAEKTAGVNSAVDAVKKGHKELDGRIAEIQSQLSKNSEVTTETKDAFQQQVEKISTLETELDDLAKKLIKLPGTSSGQPTLAKLAAESENLKSYRGGKVELATMAGPAFSKTIWSDSGSAGALVSAERVEGVMQPEQMLTIRDLLTVTTTQSNAVEWFQQLYRGFGTNNSPELPIPQDNTSGISVTAQQEGTPKSKSDIKFVLKTSSVATLAHWFPVTRQILDDAPQLQGLIESEGRYGLALEEEQQLLFGDGTNGNLHGLYPQAAAYNVASDKAGDTNVDRIRRMILQVALQRYPTTAVVINPADFADIELTKTADNAYLFSNPQNATETRIWGKRVIESSSLTAGDGTTGGQCLVGNFALAATLYDRQQSTVLIADQHEDYFIRNMLAILVEERLALAVKRPLALCAGALHV